MKRIKSFNITLSILTTISIWCTDMQQEDKISLTIFFMIVIGFWLSAGKRIPNYK